MRVLGLFQCNKIGSLANAWVKNHEFPIFSNALESLFFSALHLFHIQ